MKNVITLSIGLVLLFMVAVEIHAAQDIIVSTSISPDTIVTTGSIALVYGSSDANQVTIENGAEAELINFPGNNIITIQSDSSLFMVSRSGATATFEGADGTFLKMPATTTSQSIIFDDGSKSLIIDSGRVLLDNQMIDSTPTAITENSVKNLAITFEPNDVTATWNSSYGEWFNYFTYRVFNPNDFPVEVVAWGQFNECLSNIEECTVDLSNFEDWLTSCGEGSLYIPAKGYACDNYWWNYGYAIDGDVTGNYAIWFKDNNGNVHVSVSEDLTLRQPSSND